MSSVCAIVLDYFGAEKTERCLQSLYGQGIAEARVIDNSGDRRYQTGFARQVERLGRSADFRLRYVANEKNLGFGRAINRALATASDDKAFEYYLVINNDARAEAGMVDSLVQALRERPDAGVVAPWTKTGNGAFCGFWYQRQMGLIARRPLPGAFHYLAGSCLLVDASLAGANLFDEAFFMYGEDVELGWRLRRRGLRPHGVEGAMLRHVGVGSSHEGQLFYEYHVVKGHLLLATRLSASVLEWPVMWLGRLLVLPIRALVRAVRFRTPWPLVALALACVPWRLDVRVPEKK